MPLFLVKKTRTISGYLYDGTPEMRRKIIDWCKARSRIATSYYEIIAESRGFMYYPGRFETEQEITKGTYVYFDIKGRGPLLATEEEFSKIACIKPLSPILKGRKVRNA